MNEFLTSAFEMDRTFGAGQALARMAGALSIVRFRTVVRDTRDTAFAFAPRPTRPPEARTGARRSTGARADCCRSAGTVRT